VGLGLTTTVFLTGSNNGLNSDVSALGISLNPAEQQSVRGVLAGTDSANQILTQYTQQIADQLVDIVRHAFASGMRWAFILDGALAVCGFVVALLFVGGSLLHRDEDDPEQATT
jgi:hypothetical protein